MAILGEIQIAKTIGRIAGKGYAKFAWYACPLCGKERWVELMSNYEPKYTLCLGCSRKGKRYAWKGGQVMSVDGYVLLARPNHPFARRDGYIKRARLILEQKLGRYLLPSEVSHHINSIKTDDRPENLTAFPSQAEHMQLHNPRGTLWGRNAYGIGLRGNENTRL